MQARFKGSEAALAANIKAIRAHNADRTQTWKMGVNQVRAVHFHVSFASYRTSFVTLLPIITRAPICRV